MSSVHCVTAAEADSPDLVRWMRAFYAEERLEFSGECERALGELLRDEKLGRAVVLRENDRGAGYFLLAFGFSVERGGKTALLDELYVIPEARGRGIGKAAVADAMRLAREANCRAIFVEVDIKNESARGLYRKCGFAEMGRDYLSARL